MKWCAGAGEGTGRTEGRRRGGAGEAEGRRRGGGGEGTRREARRMEPAGRGWGRKPRSLCLKGRPCPVRVGKGKGDKGRGLRQRVNARASTPATVGGRAAGGMLVRGALGLGIGLGFGLGIGVSNVILTGQPVDEFAEEEEVLSREKGLKGNLGVLVTRLKPSPFRNVTDALIQLNTLTFALQKLSRGWLSAWGCKHNMAIASGQLWRLFTPAFLHGNLIHLMVNCYSLNHIGPKTEAMFGSNRMLAIYMLSGISGNLYSYYFNRLPAVGSSGALFGLLGALGFFYYRHRKVLAKQVEQPLRSLRNVLVANLLIGLSTPNIDNWAHIGGVVAGAATVMLLGPNLVIEDGAKGDSKADRPFLVDKPPIPIFASKPLPLL